MNAPGRVSISTVARMVPSGKFSIDWAEMKTLFHSRASRLCSSLGR